MASVSSPSTQSLSRSRSSPQPVQASLACDPFWSKKLTHSHSTFGAAPKALPSPAKDDKYNVEEDTDTWIPIDKFGVHHKRLQIESVWGRYASPPGPGEYNPDHEKRSKMESFPSHAFPSKPVDYYFTDLDFKKKNPPGKVIGGLPDLFAIKPSRSTASSGGDLKNVNVEDMRNALLPGPGAYGGDYRKIEKFAQPGRAVMKPRQPVAVPRKVLDHNTLEFLDMPARRQLFDGSYYSEHDPTKKNHGAHSFGYKRPLHMLPEHCSPGPGAYNVDPVQHMGAANPVSSGEGLHTKSVPRTAITRTKINFAAPSKSFGRKSLLN